VKIEITNLQKDHEINEDLIHRILEHVAGEAGLSGTLSVAVVDAEEITELNRRFLGHAEPTDVLSFPMQDETSDLFGEVIVCAAVAAREAKKRNISFDAELALYAVHGLLHLLGYDDSTPGKRARMQERERAILAEFNLSAHDEEDGEPE
jgi:probable rRNA maturation factor